MNIRFSRKCVWICATNINHLLYPNKKYPPLSHKPKTMYSLHPQYQITFFCYDSMVFFVDASILCVFFFFLNLFVIHLISAFYTYLISLLSSVSITFVHEKFVLSHWQAHYLSCSGMLPWQWFGIFITWETCRFCHTIYRFMGWLCSRRICIYWGNICFWGTGLSLKAFKWSTEIDTKEKGIIAPGWILLGVKLWYEVVFIAGAKDMSSRKQSLDMVLEEIVSVQWLFKDVCMIFM